MAKSNVQVMLTKEVSKLGKLGDLVNVAPGYAQNYLIPRGLAVRATAGIVREVERRREQERQRQLAIRQEAENRKATLSALTGLIIKKKAGEGDSLFGSVTESDVSQLIAAKSTLEIDRRTINLPEIRKVGTYQVAIKLHAEVTATIELQVVPE